MSTIFSEQVTAADISRMPADFRDALVHQLAANGEGELSAGDTYVDSFYPLAPTADERYKCAQFAMEEIDHYRKFATLLFEIGIDISHMVGQAKDDRRYFPADSMTVQFSTWEERAAFSFLCELEGHYQITEMATSTYAPLAAVAPSILKEEAGHFGHGVTLMRRATQNKAAKATAQAALERFYPMALDMFGRSDSRRSDSAVRWGLRKHTNGQLRDIYKTDIAHHIARLGYTVPEDDLTKRKFL